MSSIDYSRPLAALMRDSTMEFHDVVANSEGAKMLNSGNLPKHEYVRYLMILWHVYDALERGLDEHASHPALEPTYNPALLARASALSDDISYLTQLDEASWKSHPTNLALLRQLNSDGPSPLNGVQAYVARLNELASSSDPSPLLAHAYVRYLGDLSGGQTIRYILAKAYDLSLDDASSSTPGLDFYAFHEQVGSTSARKMAGLGEMKRIKEWFREGMNQAGRVCPELKPTIVEETKRAFVLNADILSMLRTTPSKASTNDILVDVKHSDAKASEKLRVGKGEVIHDLSQQEETQESGGYPLASVVAILAAMCITHFVLVVGGFTGDRGYDKLVATQRWLTNLFQQQGIAGATLD